VDVDLVAGLGLAHAVGFGEDFGLEMLYKALARHACRIASRGVTCLVVDNLASESGRSQGEDEGELHADVYV